MSDYTPEPAPLDPIALSAYIERELYRISDELKMVGDYGVTYAEPDRPKEGMVRYADGTSWNPGAGKGLYVYDGTTWVKL